MNKLLFICGFPSGGTDLTKTILNAHPHININGEIPLLVNLAKYGYSAETTFTTPGEIEDFQNLLRRLDTWQNIKDIDHDFSQELTEKKQLSLTEILRTSFSAENQQVWGSKTPQFTENILLLHQLFPEAFFLIVVRDIRDVTLSWQKKWGKDKLLTAQKWKSRMKTGWNAAQQLPPEQFMFFKFEDLLLTTEISLRLICDFLIVPFSERMLAHQDYTLETVDGKINYGQRINPENKAKWTAQLAEPMIKRIEEIAYETMLVFDYQVQFATKPKSIKRTEVIRGRIRDLLALFFVGNRSSNRGFLQKRLHEIGGEIRKRLIFKV